MPLTIRKVYGPRSRNTHQVRSKKGNLLNTPDEIKYRWIEKFIRSPQTCWRNWQSILAELGPATGKGGARSSY